jgi:hypothetical protein
MLEMNSEKLVQKLVAAARADHPADHVPYAFEKRITARLPARSAPDFAALWARALWRAAVPCVAVPLLLGLWATSPSHRDALDNEISLSQQFEETVYASVEQQLGDIEEQ